MLLTKPKQNLLLTLAWQSIANGIKNGKPLKIDVTRYPADFAELRATFVILEYKHSPRGSFGSLRPIRSLAEDVCENAFAAAFCDRHFPSVTDMELEELQIQIDLLSPLQNMAFSSEVELIGQLRPNIDGLVLEDEARHACLMPAHWKTFNNPMLFLQQLKKKAGLPVTYWSKNVKVSRFTIENIS